ncbi:MAG: class I SAM-dependent methyltransferase [Anaerolineae bacterium]
MLVAAAYWLLVLSEGVYLGPRVVTWLYDLTARRYEGIKQFEPDYERLLLGEPILSALAHFPDATMLDVATGTGRLWRSLPPGSTAPRLVGLDRSRPMLLEGRHLLSEGQAVPLVQADALHLPFADASFTAVSCLEALEFVPDSRRALAEMARVLVPDGLLVITNRKGAARWSMPGHVFGQEALQRRLEEVGFARVCFERWQVDYDLVMARRRPR